ncbi:MAG: methionyl-tRNA synthetase, partial [Gaiellales bacterium]|nr:methionyl-tRNA synthetase [Gaiellales bacterium]
DLVDGRCPEHGTVPTFTEERNTFFRLSAYADELLARYAADPPFVLPQTRLNEVRSFVEGGLQDVSITREAVNWGVPLPWDPDQAIYVWIDALINYTSALTYARPGEDLTGRLWPARWQLLGKDILRFHAVIWPAMLLSAGYELPRQLFIHGMLAGQDGHRMSKTRGNAMDYRPAVALYGPDALRYYLLREVAFGQDGGVGYQGMHDRYHGELANELGNLVSRSIAMVDRYRGGVIPEVASAAELSALSAEVAAAYERRFDVLDFTGALEHVWELVRALNRFVETRTPWVLAKSDDPADAAALDETLATLSEGVRALAVLLWPFLPSRAPLILAAVGEAGDDIGFDRAVIGIGSGRTVDASGGSLFPRIDTPAA